MGVAKMSAKKSSAQKKSSSGNPSYKDMVIEAITEQKERSGSSLDSIKKFLGSKYQIDVAKQAGLLNRTLKKMRDDGVLVPGAQPGRKGSGSFKVSAEEKARIGNAAKAAAKKVKKTGGSAEKAQTKKVAATAKKPTSKKAQPAVLAKKKKASKE